MTQFAVGIARKLLLALSASLVLALVSCGNQSTLEGVITGKTKRSSLSAPQLMRAGQQGKAVSGAPVGLRLTWTYVDDPGAVGYYLYRDTQSIPDPGPDGFIDPALRANGGDPVDQPVSGPDVVYDDIFDAEVGTTYFYRVTVLDSIGQESYPSNELSWTVHGHNVAGMSPLEAYYGDDVTITGDTFGDYDALTDKVFFTALSGPPIEGAVVSWTDTEIVATVPAGSFDGPVAVSVDSTLAQSDDDLVILNPIVTSVEPAQQFAGDSVTVSGFNFAALQESSMVQLGGSDVTAGVTTWADEEIQLDLPLDAADGLLTVTVLGVASNGAAVQIRPQISSLDITMPQSGELLTLSGNNFDEDTGRVLLDGSSEQVVFDWNPDSVQFTLDALTIGTHSLVVEDAAGLLSNEFEVEVVAPLTVTIIGLASQFYRASETPSLSLTADTAADADMVELLVDGEVVSSSSTAPFSELLLEFGKLSNGDHSVGMRAQRRAISVSSIEIDIQVYSLVGDIDGSGLVDEDDRDALEALIGLKQEDAAFRAWFDPLEDGEVNESDLTGVGYRFGDALP